MENERVTESRRLVHSACRRALDSMGEEPNPPLTGEGSDLGSTYKSSMKPVLKRVLDARERGDELALASTSEELVVESLFLLARVMELSGLYSDEGVDTPLTAACYFALGSYLEQEATKGDQWRGESFETLYSNVANEVEIVRDNISNDDLDHLLRNSVDVVLLSGILHAAVLTRMPEPAPI